VQHVVADPSQERSLGVDAEPARLRTQRPLVGPRPRDQEAHVAEPLDQPGKRVERQLEALLVHQPADQQQQALVGSGELGAQALEVLHRLEVERVDPVRDHRHPRLLQAVDIGHVPAHVVRAGDHALGAVGHPPLDPVDV
jgi:hypothetical protein